MTIINYKSWIQNRAEEIALEKYDAGFCDLAEDKRAEVYDQAIEDYRDRIADQIDAVIADRKCKEVRK